MKVHFYKYQGTGNDFIIIDNRISETNLNREQIQNLCNRRLGIGADGLIFLETSNTNDFKMNYYNSDGNESSMCGNGGRCLSHFAGLMGIIHHHGTFEAVDGQHNFELLEQDIVKLKMTDVTNIINNGSEYIIDTGSPHYVKFQNDINELDIINEAKKIRYNHTFREKGINVNFVETRESEFFMRTYERGVENETLSCGTGTVAVAIALVKEKFANDSPITINTYGGQLKVHFREIDGGFSDIWLEGPAKKVFEGYF